MRSAFFETEWSSPSRRIIHSLLTWPPSRSEGWSWRRGQRKGQERIVSESGDEEKITLDFFSEPHHISFPQIEFYSPSKKTVSLVTRILLLHYLIRADGSPMTGKWVGYKDIPGGLLYASVFARRVTDPLVRRFGRAAKWFKEAGIQLGGETAGVGDASFTLKAFPFIPVQYVLWEGDGRISSCGSTPLRCLRGSLPFPGRYCGAQPDNDREVDSTGDDQSKNAGRLEVGA